MKVKWLCVHPVGCDTSSGKVREIPVLCRSGRLANYLERLLRCVFLVHLRLTSSGLRGILFPLAGGTWSYQFFSTRLRILKLVHMFSAMGSRSSSLSMEMFTDIVGARACLRPDGGTFLLVQPYNHIYYQQIYFVINV